MASVHDYLKRATEVYNKARQAWEPLRDERAAIAVAMDAANNDKEITQAARRNRQIELRNQYKTKTDEMLAVSADMRRNLSEVRADMERRFYSHYHATAEALDTRAQALIQSGVLSIDELIDMGGRFKKNETMRRIVGAELEKRLANDRMMNTAQADRVKQFTVWCAQPVQQEHLQTFDVMTDYFNKAVGGPRKSGGDYSDTADKFAQIVAEQTQAAIENCEDVVVDD